jgi:hypothetical protein
MTQKANCQRRLSSQARSRYDDRSRKLHLYGLGNYRKKLNEALAADVR